MVVADHMCALRPHASAGMPPTPARRPLGMVGEFRKQVSRPIDRVSAIRLRRGAGPFLAGSVGTVQLRGDRRPKGDDNAGTPVRATALIEGLD